MLSYRHRRQRQGNESARTEWICFDCHMMDRLRGSPYT